MHRLPFRLNATNQLALRYSIWYPIQEWRRAILNMTVQIIIKIKVKPLPEPILTDHQWNPLTLVSEQFHKLCLNHQSLNFFLKITCLKFHSNFPGADELSIILISSMLSTGNKTDRARRYPFVPIAWKQWQTIKAMKVWHWATQLYKKQ